MVECNRRAEAGQILTGSDGTPTVMGKWPRNDGFDPAEVVSISQGISGDH